MKIIFLVVALFFVLTPAYGQMLLSDATGLVNRLDVQTGGQSFEIEIVSNFDIREFEFNKDDKKLTLYIASSLENNLGEILIPKKLLSGNLTFYLNGEEHLPLINSNEKISFITLNFTGSGDSKLEIFGTQYLSGLVDSGFIDANIKKTLQKEEDTSDDSFGWIILAGSVIAVTIFAAIKLKKRG